MAQTLSDTEVEEALATCASEQVHIPGIVQPFACMVAVDPASKVVSFASVNTEAVIGVEHGALLGASFEEIVGREVWHSIQNMLSRPGSAESSAYVGDFSVNGKPCAIHVFLSDGLMVLEFERPQASNLSGSEGLKALGFLMEKIQACANEETLFNLTTQLLRQMSGFDRVMVYRFDASFNGEIVAEDRRKGTQSFLGLRFPHWDIPAQAREMIMKIPLRFIEDVGQNPVELRSADSRMHPLDISLGYSRGVSTVHMEYLRNVGVAATMTLTVKIDSQLWGIISFHHNSPRVPAPDLRSVLAQTVGIFSTKLQVLQQQRRLDLVSRVDGLKDRVLSDLSNSDGFEGFAQSVLQILDADGILVQQGSDEKSYGRLPDTLALDRLKLVASEQSDVRRFENLSEAFPDLSNSMNGCAGAIFFAPDSDRRLLIFRNEIEQEVAWAGNPNKTIEMQEGRLRLSPRGAFSAYLEQVRGAAKPWSEQDLYFASRIWTLVNSVERRELVSTLNRQQKIMIDELNHRVRNILALIRSVSSQARGNSYGSLESYSRSLEARIQALAASHDLASGSVVTSVPIEELIRQEFEPYDLNGGSRVVFEGSGKALRAEIAPIFSLVVHELVTNAVKYGALSGVTGRVSISMREQDGGLGVEWREVGGPKVVEPKGRGFGTSLIQQAVPYELKGKAELKFLPNGVAASFLLPAELFDTSLSAAEWHDEATKLRPVDDEAHIRALLKTASCLIVEDNFLIATETSDQVSGFGTGDVHIESSVQGAMTFLDDAMPTFAVLDMNLGQGETSMPIAKRLLEAKVPFMFVTGYGDSAHIDEEFRSVMRLTKPVPTGALFSAVAELVTADA